MNDDFERKVRAAAVAGWWTVLFAVGFLILGWIAFLRIMSAQPAWMASLWGPYASWEYVYNVGFWTLSIFKLCIWLMVFVVAWLTLWARQLRKSAGRR
jgi:hypothetical protein